MRATQEQLRKKEQEIGELKETVTKMQPLLEFAESFESSEQVESFLTVLKQSMGGKNPTLVIHVDPEFMQEDVAVESLKRLLERSYELEKEKRQKEI